MPFYRLIVAYFGIYVKSKYLFECEMKQVFSDLTLFFYIKLIDHPDDENLCGNQHTTAKNCTSSHLFLYQITVMLWFDIRANTELPILFALKLQLNTSNKTEDTKVAG